MRNLAFLISYEGTNYHGYQLQPNALTIQEVLSKAYQKITGQAGDLKGCSRTDSGVHARSFCFSVKTEASIPCGGFVKALNTVLPDDIAVKDCCEAAPDFHARFCCKGKEYLYIVDTAKVRNPFLANRAMHYPYELDARLMDKAAKHLIGKHDFSAFCSANSGKSDFVRTIFDAGAKDYSGTIVFNISGDGFLYNMVRIIAGTLLDISRGRIDCDALPAIIDSKSRAAAGLTAPPEGLYLNRLFYDDAEVDKMMQNNLNGACLWPGSPL